MATDPKIMTEAEITKLLKPFDAIRDKLPVEKDQIAAPPAVRSTDWLDSLRRYQEKLTDDERRKLWLRIIEGYCWNCARRVRENEVCHCENDE